MHCEESLPKEIECSSKRSGSKTRSVFLNKAADYLRIRFLGRLNGYYPCISHGVVLRWMSASGFTNMAEKPLPCQSLLLQRTVLDELR